MSEIATTIDRTFLKVVYRPEFGFARTSKTLRANDSYWNTHFDQLLAMWRGGLDTAQIALRCGVSEAECYNAFAGSWDWAVEDRRLTEERLPARRGALA